LIHIGINKAAVGSIIFSALMLLYAPLLYADTSLTAFIEENGARFYWEPGRRIGLIVKDDRLVTLDIGSGTMLLGRRPQRLEVSVQPDGSLRLDDKSLIRIRAYLLQETLPVANRQHEVAVILIDAGHGGKDSGAIGRHGSFTVKEKDICLTVALELERLLKARYPDKKIIMTRRNDRYLTLEERVKMANEQKLGENQAEIYISIHANAAFNKEATGFEVWRLPDGTSRELFTDEGIDYNTQSAINMLLNAEYLAESKTLAGYLLRSMEKKLGHVMKNRGEREENWFVVRNAKMAAVLVEIGFVTNETEARLLSRESHLKLIGQSLYTGIKDFIEYFEQ
jgi:N-acetylmuramoyl-L-alanine amidase